MDVSLYNMRETVIVQVMTPEHNLEKSSASGRYYRATSDFSGQHQYPSGQSSASVP